MPFAAAELPYAKDALVSKGLSKEQVEFHYEKHHKGYAAKLNAAILTTPELAHLSLVEAVKTMTGPIFNSAGQLFNHDFYWQSMSPCGGGEPTGDLADAINASFGSFENFKEEFTAAAGGHFGSGWAWLLLETGSGKLKVYQTHDAGCPIVDPTLVPLLACDVWEHAYYIDYRNDRPKYVNAWWGMVNWDFAAAQFDKANA
ncbi:unnamed protein product [Phytomonas sp. Hart1]|nr:unnamed protein product [Phytomonas sp. Hart1]|eukprot:CCW70667.1 unnamed protein product [Phytomonas sp. isolate Hart1]